MDPSDPLSKTLTTLSKGGRLSVPKGKNKQQRTSRNLSPLPCARFNIYKIFEAWHTWPRKSAAKIKIERVNRWKGPNFTREGEYRCIFERKREREGGEKEGPGKFGLSLEEEEREKEERNMKRDKTKKKGSHTVESTDTRETRSHLPTSSLTLCTLFFTAFQPWNHLPTRVGEETKGKGRVTVLLFRSRTKMEIFLL